MASSRRSPPIHGRRASGDKRKQFRNLSKESTRERPSATARHIPTNGKHSSRFARGAVFAEFRRRDARALDYDGFADHDPDAALQDADKIIRHLDVLAEEVRNAKGAATLAYEAAHFFLCYP